MSTSTDIHLHHAVSHASSAITHLSAASMWAGTATLENQAIEYARDYLAKAAAELNAYDAKRQVVKTANAA